MEDNNRLLRLSEVLKIVSVSRNTVYRMMEEGHFPRPVRISTKAVRWNLSEIEEWLKARPRTG